MYSTNSPGFITRRGRFIEIWGLEKSKKMKFDDYPTHEFSFLDIVTIGFLYIIGKPMKFVDGTNNFFRTFFLKKKFCGPSKLTYF